MSIIELGEIRDEPASSPAVRTPRAVGRPLRSAAVLLLALVLLAGATPPPERTMSAVPASPASTAYLAPDTVLVFDPPTPDQDRYLTAYAQPAPGDAGLRPRWRAPLPGQGDYLGVRVERGLVLAMGVEAGDGVFETTAFDAVTGQQRWRHPGTPVPIADGGLLLTDVRQSATDGMSRLDPETGRVLWSVSLLSPTGPSFHLTDGRIDRFVLVQPTGEVQVHDAITGRLLHSLDTLPGDRKAVQRVQVAGDLLVVIPADDGPVVGYGLAGLEPRWTAQVSLVSFVAGCGDLLCASLQDGSLRVLDPATGVVRWSGPVEELLVDVRGDRLLMGGPGHQYVARDAATGRTRTELGDWDLVPALRPDDPLVGLRRGDDGRMVVAELDLAADRARILDALPDVAGSCQASLPVLLCQRLDGSATLWRLRR
ncbi:PQQ-binding-like beta-propeller repeat protein [Micromonospora sp. NPDC023888]|uniref:outer membrane protein assembly factor BamB family protein n=1 Tax=Micromonospora sp. NPDC023888 TaxID=3155607 RepID=UPI0033D18C95